MEATKPRLGRGLNALLGDVGVNGSRVESGPVGRIAVGRIQANPHQPRKLFDDDELQALTSSIKTHGVLQPLVVRVASDGYQLIAGERRLRAAQAAGLSEVPVHVVNFDDQQIFEAALVENIQRSDLNPIEKAQGFKEYLDRFGLTQEQLGGKLGLDRSSISNLLGLLNLPKEVQDAVRLGQITLGHAKILKGVPVERQVPPARRRSLKNYSVHAPGSGQTTADRGRQHSRRKRTREPVEKTAHAAGLEDVCASLAVKVEIRVKAKDKGQIVIAFDSTTTSSGS